MSFRFRFFNYQIKRFMNTTHIRKRHLSRVIPSHLNNFLLVVLILHMLMEQLVFATTAVVSYHLSVEGRIIISALQGSTPIDTPI